MRFGRRHQDLGLIVAIPFIGFTRAVNRTSALAFPSLKAEPNSMMANAAATPAGIEYRKSGNLMSIRGHAKKEEHWDRLQRRELFLHDRC
jgi:hypothetical protein